MARVIGVEVLLFLLPFAFYALWLTAQRRAIAAGEHWRAAVVSWISLAGLAAMGAGLLALGIEHGHDGGKAYTPTHLENGKLVPGGFR
jgi:hypothetical protein